MTTVRVCGCLWKASRRWDIEKHSRVQGGLLRVVYTQVLCVDFIPSLGWISNLSLIGSLLAAPCKSARTCKDLFFWHRHEIQHAPVMISRHRQEMRHAPITFFHRHALRQALFTICWQRHAFRHASVMLFRHGQAIGHTHTRQLDTVTHICTFSIGFIGTFT